MSEIVDAKQWWTSKGVIGGIVSFAVSLAVLCGVQLPEDFVGQATEVVLGAVGVASSALAIYGRIKASKTIK
jgi:hypothetical protein